MLKITDLLFRYRKGFLFSDEIPVLFWRAESDRKDNRQTKYRLSVFDGEECVCDSGETVSEEQSYLPSFPLKPYTAYRCRVAVEDAYGETAAAENTFETGKLADPWTAAWISSERPLDDDSEAPVYEFVKKISLSGTPAKARLYASALGIYTVSLGGVPVSDAYFTPGYTQYTDRVPYDAYDVTDLVGKDTEIRARLAGGWYTGRLGISLKGNRYGDKRALLLELHVTYADGRKEVFGTDESWLYTEDGPCRLASFFDGETYDARREVESGRNYRNAVRFLGFAPATEMNSGVFVKRRETLSPVSFERTEDGIVAGFSKNAAGVLELRDIGGEAGRTVTVTHGEILKDGKVYTDNLRSAKARITYICRDGVQSYAPSFTYMGFQYVCVKGIRLGPENLLFHVLSSDNEETGSFVCSDERLNRLQKNIVTSQTSNFLAIPTDCPQRDERCGWTGDIAVFAETACFNMNADAFLSSWLKDVRLCQTHRGVVPMFVPDGMFGRKKKDGPYGMIHRLDDAVWGDCIVLVPWEIYRATGDTKVLSDNYESMKAWAAYEKRQAAKFSVGKRKYIWSWGFHFGDWLAPGESILKNMSKAKWTSTAYFARTCALLSEIAGILGYGEDAETYRALFENIRAAFRKVFLNKKGEIKKGFQSAYALAIAFGLLSEEEKKVNGDLLAADAESRGYHLTTGFAGTPQLLNALSLSGHEETAFRLLFEETCPGWLYPVKCGATSMWERWDALREDGSVNTDSVGGGSMVSFSHYAYGAVGSWLYGTIGGLRIAEPGWKKVLVAPRPGHGVTSCAASHRSPYGEVRADWEETEDEFVLTVTVPFGCTARAVLPDGTETELGSGTNVLTRRKGK